MKFKVNGWKLQELERVLPPNLEVAFERRGSVRAIADWTPKKQVPVLAML